MNKHLFEAQQVLKLMGMTTDSAHNLFVNLPNHEEAEDYVRKLKSKYKDVKIISRPPNGQGKYEIMATDNDATENGALEGNLGSDRETESMPLEKDPVLAQDNKLLELKELREELGKAKTKLDDLLKEEYVDTVIYKQNKDKKLSQQIEQQKRLVKQIEKEIKDKMSHEIVKDEDPKAELIKYAEATKDPEYIKHVKGLTNMNTINARLQWHRQKADDGYNFEDPKKIQEVINKLEKDLKEGKYVDMNYLAGVKRALEMAKKERTTKDEKTYQNGEHVKVVNRETGDKINLKVLRDNKDGTLEVKAPTGAVITIKKTWIVDSATILDECMEVLKLSGFATDAYDPSQYEGTIEHRRNLFSLENSLGSFKDRAEKSKERIARLRNMVASGKYGSATVRELKEEEREYENILMKIQQVRSMIQRMKGQK